MYLKNKRNKGFALIELLIVVAIPAYQNYTQQAKETQDIADKKRTLCSSISII